eukprot:scaffold616414_cov50-Prasinocladus_malaysianus.AAC.1
MPIEAANNSLGLMELLGCFAGTPGGGQDHLRPGGDAAVGAVLPVWRQEDPGMLPGNLRIVKLNPHVMHTPICISKRFEAIFCA